MSHRRSFSARLEMDRISVQRSGFPLKPPLSPIPDVSTFVKWGDDAGLSTSRKSRSFWYRTCFLALFTLAAVSVYVVFVAQPTLRPIAHVGVDHSDPPASAHGGSHWTANTFRAAMRHRKPKPAAATVHSEPQVSLNATQELACLSSFIASLPQNVVPSTVDPSKPIDPQLILDFDTRGPHADDEVDAVVADVWVQNPVMLYSKIHSPASREIKKLLADMYLKPAPTIVEVDERSDETTLTQILFRLSGKTELPILIVGGDVVPGTADGVKLLAEKGELRRMITQAGAVIDGARKKKGKKA